jgi:hypothetical protein
MVVESERMLLNSYYVSCALRFVDSLNKLDIPFVCELYTEVVSKAFVVTPRHHGIEGRIPGNVIIDPQVNRLEDFDIIPNLARFINGDPIETLRSMATADALVLSRSSYSHVAALLKRELHCGLSPVLAQPLKRVADLRCEWHRVRRGPHYAAGMLAA